MNDDMQAGMAEATRLTLARRLAEATATIQHALWAVAASDAPPWPSPDVLRRPAGRPCAPGRVRPVAPDGVPSPPGQFVDGTYTNAAGTRSYKLYIPSGYAGQTVPLVVMLHGCTQTATD